MNHFACAVIDETLKIWSPKDVEEVKCVIKSLRKKIINAKNMLLVYKFKYAAAKWQSTGKLGLHAFKSTCLNKFKLCDLAFPRDLKEDFLRLIVPAPKNVNLGRYNGTCLMFTYNYADPNVKDLVLKEVSCVDKQASFICEVF